MRSDEVRKTFLSYFEARGHTIVPSASLIPAGDPTLLFTNAGMVPFKDVFLGRETRSYTRAASVQKCLRVSGKHNDLEEVGTSPRHQTFFEMLGNFSFGDYFKPDAIEFAWEFLTKELALPREKLHPTVFEEDEESAQLWSSIAGYADSAVVRLGAEDNFWAMGDTGPCGPNSEIIYDRTGRCLRDGSDCALTCDCDRWWEIWNLVFMQYDRSADGTLSPLAKPGVDTGMGFERITSVLQGVETNYENDLFLPLIDALRSLTGDAEITSERLPAYRAVADHSRAIAFLIADGVMPSNEGRGYVLRRILRRASYQGRTLGLERAFLASVCARVIEVMGGAYREVLENKARILELVSDEEERFLTTLDTGLTRLESAIDEIARAGREKTLPGDEAFRLYDTYGFPIDLTRRVLEARGWSVDEAGFNEALEAQRERARAAGALANARAREGQIAGIDGLKGTRFVGYDSTSARTEATHIFMGGGSVGMTYEDAEAEIVLEETPFYAEGGGQVTDTGKIVAFTDEYDDGSVRAHGEFQIQHVLRTASGVFLHQGVVTRGHILAGDKVVAEVDLERRADTMRNHTATHLLHRALRVVLGPHAKQAGSLVAPDRLRFDFFHNKPLTEGELRETERLVREQVLLDAPVRADVMPVQQAIASGADAMFDEKYGEEARVVSIGDPRVRLQPDDSKVGLQPDGGAFSRELCGGTHCHATGEIGAFVITDQRSVGAGVRRVEALTGRGAFAWLDARRRVAEELSREYNVPVDELPARIHSLQERASASGGPKAPVDTLPDPASLIASAEQRNGTLLIIDRVDAPDADALRAFGDQLRQRAKSAAVVLGSVIEEKPTIVVMLTADQVQAGHDAAKLAKQLGAEMGAGGGGRPDVATAGGRDASRLDAALAKARELLGAAS